MDLCASTGQCELVAPDVFHFEGDQLVWDSDPAESLRSAVEEAVDLCPMQAITVEPA